MKNCHLVIIASLFILASCRINNSNSNGSSKTDSSQIDVLEIKHGLQGILQIRDTITIGDPVELKFTVTNLEDTTQQFLKWSTPFEPLVSRYLDITDEDGTQVDYLGPMVKRAMPPSADSYVKLNPHDSLLANINLLEGYAITRPSKYTIIYVGEGLSGITVRNSVTFVYRKAK